MNRKFHNSLMALSTTGLLLVVGLIAATTVSVADPMPVADRAVAADATDLCVGARERRLQAQAATGQARTRAFEAEFLEAKDDAQALAATAALVAEVAAESTLSAVFAEAETAAKAVEAAEQTEYRAQRKRRSIRSALALPYFSFAHGLRGGKGG